MSTSSGLPPAPDSTSVPATVPVVNTIQTVRSPIWSVPPLAEGQLGVGVASSSSLVTASEPPPVGQVVTVAQDPSPLTSPAIASGRGVDVGRFMAMKRTVVAKPIAPRQVVQQQPAGVVNLERSSPMKGAHLSQLASSLPKLTPELLLASMKSLQQQVHPTMLGGTPQQHAFVQGLQQSAGSSTGMVDVSRPMRAARGKQIMPKQLHKAGAMIIPHNIALQSGPQKIVAPVAIPPSAAHPMAIPIGVVDSSTSSTQTIPRAITTSKPRKPCNCKNSQCLKLYCDCFANGEFCRESCNCHNCKNNMDYAEDRAKAVKTCLDRNPHAFKPKVGQNKSGDERRHIKGCNCKRSGCLKNYCECYEAKIPCSANCRCIGCKNLPEKPENKSLMQLADAADIRTQQQRAATSHFMEQLDLSSKPQPKTLSGQRLPFSFINKEVAKATCLCLLEEASHALMNGSSPADTERAVLEEFGRCMTQIISSTQTANEDGTFRTMSVH